MRPWEDLHYHRRAQHLEHDAQRSAAVNIGLVGLLLIAGSLLAAVVLLWWQL